MFADPEHPQIGFKRKMQLYFEMIYKCHPQFKISITAYVFTLAAMNIDRNRKNHRSFYLIISCAIAVFSYILFVPGLTYKYYNALIFPMIFVGLTSYILCENKPKKLFASMFMTGIIYSVCVCFSSNQYFYVISMASAISNIASFIFLGVLLKEMKERNDEVAYGRALKSASLIMAAFTIIVLGSLQIKAKANHCFWESGTPGTLNARIENGPAKGIYTNEENAAAYENLYRDLYYYKGCEPGNILMLSGKTWCYLALNDFPYGTYSAWLSGEDSSLVRLEEYYSLNPDKIPVYIYIPKTSKYDFASINSAAQSKGYWLSENDISYKLTKKAE